MPRRSAAALTTTPEPIRAPAPRLTVPAGLTAAERDVWTSTIAELPAGWFRGQGAILERYAKHLVRARCLEAMLAETDAAADLVRFVKLSRLSAEETGRILACARAMRLTSQSRVLPGTAATRAAQATPVRDIRELLEGCRAND